MDLGAELEQHAIEIVTLPPTALATLNPESLPELRTIVVAGEQCSAELARVWSKGRDLINGYGPTETTVCASLYHCAEGFGLGV